MYEGRLGGTGWPRRSAGHGRRYSYVTKLTKLTNVGRLARHDRLGHLAVQYKDIMGRIGPDVGLQLDAIVPQLLRRACLCHRASSADL